MTYVRLRQCHTDDGETQLDDYGKRVIREVLQILPQTGQTINPEPEEARDPNMLAEMLKARGGILPIDVLLQVLGQEQYTECLYDLATLDEDHEDFVMLYYQHTTEELPTHVMLATYYWGIIHSTLDEALAKEGMLTPSSKGLKKH